MFEVACRLYDLAVDAFNETNEQEEPPQDDNQGADYGDSKGDDSSSEPGQSSDSSDKNGDGQTVSSGGNGARRHRQPVRMGLLQILMVIPVAHQIKNMGKR